MRIRQLPEITGNPIPSYRNQNTRKKHFRETVLPSGETDAETAQGRADLGETPTAETLGMLARKVLSSSRHAESRQLARAVLRLLAGSKKQP